MSFMKNIKEKILVSNLFLFEFYRKVSIEDKLVSGSPPVEMDLSLTTHGCHAAAVNAIQLISDHLHYRMLIF